MKEYHIIHLECAKDAKISELFEQINSRIFHRRNLFEVDGLFKFQNSRTPKKKAAFDLLGLDKYFFIKKLPHLMKSKYYDQMRDDCSLYSNLGEAWDWNNPNCTESLSEEHSKALLEFFDSLSSYDVSNMMFGFDEISWTGEDPGIGTYGYKKALSFHHGGENYLSNSIIISKSPWEKKPYKAYLCCETRFRKSETVSELTTLLGKAKGEFVLYAPENGNERSEWNEVNAVVSEKFEKMRAGLWDLFEKLPHRIEPYSKIADPKTRINAPKLAKKYLATDGWEKRTHYPYSRGTVFVKEKGESELSIDMISLHGGHYLQFIMTCSSPRYMFNESTNYCRDLSTEADVCNYMENAAVIRDYFYNMM